MDSGPMLKSKSSIERFGRKPCLCWNTCQYSFGVYSASGWGCLALMTLRKSVMGDGWWVMGDG